MQNTKSYQITIIGKVQNVGFRYHTHQKAYEFGIKGFVKNLANGNVYVEAEGDSTQLNEFIKWCHKGPDWAYVIEVVIIEQPPCNFASFEIKR